MAFNLQFHLFFPIIFLFTFSVAHGPFFPTAVVLPVTKDPSTLQYITQINMGSDPSSPVHLVLDLGGPFLWVDCTSTPHLSSSSSSPILCNSLQCSMVNPSSPCSQTNKICGLNPENPITRTAASGILVENTIDVKFKDDDDSNKGSVSSLDNFLFLCAPRLLLNGLASDSKGMLGLGSSRIALPSQLASKFGFPRKFSLCLSSSSHGVILSGETPNLSMFYTPLDSGSDRDYFINVKSIRINGDKLPVDQLDESGIGRAKISTTVPYTTMDTTVYTAFARAFVEAAVGMNISRVAGVAPFDVCFDARGVDESRIGGSVPSVDLVLQSEMVKWRMDGRNAMVKVSDDVMCLGFLDGGLGRKPSIVIGGHQLEDNLLEFDLGTSMLGFGKLSCSDLKSDSMPRAWL